MMTSILGLLAGAATIVGGVLAYKNSANRQRRSAERDIAEKEAEMQSKKDEIRMSVYTNDETKINAIASRLLSQCFSSLVVLSFILGCSTKTTVQYIPTDRHIEPITNSIGIACQAVPNAVFCELLEKAQELKELRTEMAVDKRIQK